MNLFITLFLVLFVTIPFSLFAQKPTAVDMGLSVKWANFNLGATSPEGYGDYYAWGELKPKTAYTMDTYTMIKGDIFTKYNYMSEYGPVDNKYQFSHYKYVDDVARAKLGGKWRIPTQAEISELLDISLCEWKRTTQNGVNGYLVTSYKTGNSIFLPLAGLWNGTYCTRRGESGYYWSSSLNAYTPLRAWDLTLEWNFADIYPDARWYGFSIRPVTD